MTATVESMALAQEMRVYTTVRDLSSLGQGESVEKAPVIARSLTLFHAGKVYDYVDAAKEITVYEPAHRRFSLLSERHHMTSTIVQDEVRQFLSLAEEEAWKRVDSADDETPANQLRPLVWLKFQLRPEFEAAFDQAKSQVVLTAPECRTRYTVDLVSPPSREIPATYLRFADSAAQLNAILHPQAMMPAPRLRLNEELRKRELLPVMVEFRSEADRTLRLQARHEWTWKFQPTDRQLITKWESELTDPTIRKVPFRQYQLESLSQNVSRSK